MSFLDKFKGKGATRSGADDEASPFDEMMDPHADPADDPSIGGQGRATLDMNAQPVTRGSDSSIISEAAPSELAPEFDETRVQLADGAPPRRPARRCRSSATSRSSSSSAR